MRPCLVAFAAVIAVGCDQAIESDSGKPDSRDTSAAAEDTLMPELDSEVIEEIDVLVRSAFWDRERMLEIMCQELYAPGDLDERAVSAAIDSCIAKWKSSQVDWPDVTDCDRLDSVFAQLNEQGIVAMHNAGMTQSDGHDDFRDIYDKHPNKSRLLGYCYYHGQDLERVVRGGPLFFSFGPCDAKLEETEGPRVGRMIAQQLTNAGFDVEWDGTFNERIRIPKFNWQRRGIPGTR